MGLKTGFHLRLDMKSYSTTNAMITVTSICSLESLVLQELLERFHPVQRFCFDDIETCHRGLSIPMKTSVVRFAGK